MHNVLFAEHLKNSFFKLFFSSLSYYNQNKDPFHCNTNQHCTHIHILILILKILVKQNLVTAVNNLVEKDELVAWNRMKEERREHTITKLLHVVEESALSLGSNHKTPTELQIKASEMGVATVIRENLKMSLLI